MSVDPARDRLQHLLADQPAATWNGIDYVEIAEHRPDAAARSLPELVAGPGDVERDAAGDDLRRRDDRIGGRAPNRRGHSVERRRGWETDPERLGGGSRRFLDLHAHGQQHSARSLLRRSWLHLQGQLRKRPRLRSDHPAVPAARKRGGADQLPRQGLRSFTRALSDFSALRYPQWVERSEADVGVALMEALSALADELSYYQDRVAAEAVLGTATQRVSVVRHARLVDYEPAPAVAAAATLQLDVAPGVGSITSGLRCGALGPEGQRIDFEVGGLLADSQSGRLLATSFTVDPRWNAGSPTSRNLRPYWWDVSRQCLPAGSTRLWLIGHGFGLAQGAAQQLLIDTAGATSADPPVREIVQVAATAESTDPVFSVDADARRPRCADVGRSRPEAHASRRQPAARGARRPHHRDVRDPVTGRFRAALPHSPGGRTHGAELDAAGSSARLPLHARRRSGVVAADIAAGPGPQRHRGGSARDRARRDRHPGVRASLDVAAMAARVRPGGHGIHTDARALCGSRRRQLADVLRIRRRGHHDPLRRRHLRPHARPRDCRSPSRTCQAAASPATSLPTRSSQSRPVRRRRPTSSRSRILSRRTGGPMPRPFSRYATGRPRRSRPARFASCALRITSPRRSRWTG